jgi:hypothetical protein
VRGFIGSRIDTVEGTVIGGDEMFSGHGMRRVTVGSDLLILPRRGFSKRGLVTVDISI